MQKILSVVQIYNYRVTGFFRPSQMNVKLYA